ncbi:MAG: MlaD family protein [Desulfuromonadaceae bacterium]|nr:MlaD family protein [Desulfuromonadaceae bacterium]
MKLSLEVKVGLFFILSLLLFGTMLEIGNHWKLFDRGIPYKVFLASSTGLKVGDTVKLAGVEVGTISRISILDDKVQVDFEVKPGTRIKQDSVAGIRMASMLGGQFLGLSFGSPGSPDLPAGSRVKSSDSAGVDAIIDSVGSLTKDAKQLIIDLNRNQNEVMGKVNAILDENRAAVHGSLTGLASITSKLDRGDGSLGLLLNDKSLYNNVNALSGSLKEVSAKLERGEGTIGKMLTEEELYNQAITAVKGMNDGVKNITEIAQRINKGEGTVGKLVNDPALYDELRETVLNLKDITGKIKSGEGTIGKLVNDDKLYRDALSTLKKTEKAMEGLQDTGPISVIGSVVGTLF